MSTIIYNNVKAGRRVDMERFQQVEEELHNKGVMYTCDLQTFSNMIEKYGYRLNVDTNKIEEIE